MQIRVIDFSRLLPGAIATQMLCDWGAAVTKVEHPQQGDPGRTLSVSLAEGIFSAVNRGKKSVAIDLKHPSGRDAVLRLLEKADVVVESFRPGVMDRMGLGYNVVQQRNPKLVYASINGYGSTGPLADLPGHDLNYCALAGLVRPHASYASSVLPFPIADVIGGLQAANQILIALLASSGGCRLEVPLFDAAVWASPIVHALCAGGLLTGRYACYNLYKGNDDRWIAVAALETKFWDRLCHKLQRTDLITQQFRPDAQANIIQQLGALFMTHPARHWCDLLESCCVTPVTLGNSAIPPPFHEKPLAANGVSARESSTGIRRPRGSAPRLGEHTTQELFAAGIALTEIENLRAANIIATDHGENHST